MNLVLYQPDIPQNTGTIMRLCACLNVQLHVIEPCGFVLSDRNLKRAGMDYLDQLDWIKHQSWEDFIEYSEGSRLVLLTTKADLSYVNFSFVPDDYLILGRESAGVPQNVHDAADARLLIPMNAQTRSINIALSGAMVLGEALRQTSGFEQLNSN